MLAVSKKSKKNLGWSEATCVVTARKKELCAVRGQPLNPVETGCHIINIHEVWHFTPENRRVGVFKDYVNTWLKLKQESAGWTADCVTP